MLHSPAVRETETWTTAKGWMLIIALGGAACGEVEKDPAAPMQDAAIDATAPMPDAGPRIADSVADFSLVQGRGGWSYLYQVPGQPLMALAEPVEDTWWMDFDLRWTSIGDSFVHPNVTGKTNGMDNFPGAGVQFPVRRWTADVAGAADIAYTLSKRDDAVCGGGVVARIIVDGVQLVEHMIAFDDETGYTDTLHAQLHVGSTVDIIVDGLDDDGCDSTRTIAKITVR